MRTLKFKAQPTNAFFATVNQIFCSAFERLPTTVEHAVIKSLYTVQTTKHCSAVVVSWVDPPKIWLTGGKYAFVEWPLNLRVRLFILQIIKRNDNNQNVGLSQSLWKASYLIRRLFLVESERIIKKSLSCFSTHVIDKPIYTSSSQFQGN